MSTSKRLSQIYAQSDILYYDDNNCFVMMSDCHRGIGNWGDNFAPNRNLFFYALKQYKTHGYTYIELGDGEELWENRNLRDIISAYGDQYCLMAQLYAEKRLYMLLGNHDHIKENSSYIDTYYSKYCDEFTNCCHTLFPNIKVHEGLILQEKKTGNQIFLIHGNQGDFFNDTHWKLGRFLVRYVWRGLELIGFQDPTSSAKNYNKKENTEKKLSKWATNNNIILVAGHTHRPMLPTPKQGMYWNDGSCVHPYGITALEIANGTVSLVKWCEKTRADGELYIAREVIAGEYPIRKYFQ